MFSLESKGTTDPEIIAVAESVPGGNGAEGLQSIPGDPLTVFFNGVAAQQSAKHGGIGPVIVIIIPV
jgi:hypothetical protein